MADPGRQVTEANFRQGLQRPFHRGDVGEEFQGLGDRHVEHVSDRLAAILHLQRRLVEAFTMAGGARDGQIGQELHGDPQLPLPLAFLATAAFHVEAEAIGLVAAQLGRARGGEDFADLVVDAGVGGGAGA